MKRATLCLLMLLVSSQSYPYINVEKRTLIKDWYDDDEKRVLPSDFFVQGPSLTELIGRIESIECTFETDNRPLLNNEELIIMAENTLKLIEGTCKPDAMLIRLEHASNKNQIIDEWIAEYKCCGIGELNNLIAVCGFLCSNLLYEAKRNNLHEIQDKLRGMLLKLTVLQQQIEYH